MTLPPYLANNTGTYIRKDIFEAKHKKTFTLKNLKKANELRLGNIWRARKMSDTIQCYQTSSDHPDYIKVPVGIRSYIPEKFTNDYHDNQVIEHPPLTRPSYDYQSSAVQDLLTHRVGLLHASTGSGKTQMICDITIRSKRKTLIMVQNLTQMSQMVDDISATLGVTATQVSGKKISNRISATFDDRITVCSIDSRDKINTQDYGLILLDECLAGDTIIKTDKGEITIKDIVIQKLDVHVKSYNEKTKSIEYKKVINFWEKKTHQKMYRIKYIDDTGIERQIECTANHPLFIQGKGFTPTHELSVGDNLLTDLT